MQRAYLRVIQFERWRTIAGVMCGAARASHIVSRFAGVGAEVSVFVFVIIRNYLLNI